MVPRDKSFPDFKQEAIAIGTALESSCLKAGTDITGLVLILMISDHNTQFYAFISHILTFVSRVGN